MKTTTMKTTTSRSTHRKRVFLILILVFAAPLLSGCSDFEWDFFWYLAEEWSLAEGIYDGENINYEKMGEEIANDAFDSFFGGPDQVALEANNVVDDIRKADELADRGTQLATIAESPAQREEALQAIDEAIALRPGDWSYVQQRGAVLAASGDLQGYNKSSKKSYELLQQAIKNGTDCRVAHRNYYEHQLTALQTQSPVHIGEQISDVQLSLDHPENWPCQ